MCAGNNPDWYEYDLRQNNEIHQIAIQNQVPVKAGQYLPVEEKACDREGGYQQCRHIEGKQPGECLEIHRTYPDPDYSGNFRFGDTICLKCGEICYYKTRQQQGNRDNY